MEADENSTSLDKSETHSFTNKSPTELEPTGSLQIHNNTEETAQKPARNPNENDSDVTQNRESDLVLTGAENNLQDDRNPEEGQDDLNLEEGQDDLNLEEGQDDLNPEEGQDDLNLEEGQDGVASRDDLDVFSKDRDEGGVVATDENIKESEVGDDFITKMVVCLDTRVVFQGHILVPQTLDLVKLMKLGLVAKITLHPRMEDLQVREEIQSSLAEHFRHKPFSFNYLKVLPGGKYMSEVEPAEYSGARVLKLCGPKRLFITVKCHSCPKMNPQVVLEKRNWKSATTTEVSEDDEESVNENLAAEEKPPVEDVGQVKLEPVDDITDGTLSPADDSEYPDSLLAGSDSSYLPDSQHKERNLKCPTITESVMIDPSGAIQHVQYVDLDEERELIEEEEEYGEEEEEEEDYYEEMESASSTSSYSSSLYAEKEKDMLTEDRLKAAEAKVKQDIELKTEGGGRPGRQARASAVKARTSIAVMNELALISTDVNVDEKLDRRRKRPAVDDPDVVPCGFRKGTPRGRPRKHPLPQDRPPVEKRGRGRPRKRARTVRDYIGEPPTVEKASSERRRRRRPDLSVSWALIDQDDSVAALRKRMTLRGSPLEDVGDRRFYSHIKCKFCGERQRSMLHLYRHIAMIHATNTCRYECQQCGQLYKTALEMEDHATVHSLRCAEVIYQIPRRGETGKYHYQCPIIACDKKPMSWSKLINHLHYHMPKDCLVCGERIFPNPMKTFCTHVSMHIEGGPYVCPHCPKTFFSEINRFKDHLKLIHGALQTPWICRFCFKYFDAFSELDLHLLAWHTNKPYCCQYCGQDFSGILALEAHMDTHERGAAHDKLYQTCSENFRGKASFKSSHTASSSSESVVDEKPALNCRPQFQVIRKDGSVRMLKDLNKVHLPREHFDNPLSTPGRQGFMPRILQRKGLTSNPVSSPPKVVPVKPISIAPKLASGTTVAPALPIPGLMGNIIRPIVPFNLPQGSRHEVYILRPGTQIGAGPQQQMMQLVPLGTARHNPVLQSVRPATLPQPPKVIHKEKEKSLGVKPECVTEEEPDDAEEASPIVIAPIQEKEGGGSKKKTTSSAESGELKVCYHAHCFSVSSSAIDLWINHYYPTHFNRDDNFEFMCRMCAALYANFDWPPMSHSCKKPQYIHICTDCGLLFETVREKVQHFTQCKYFATKESILNAGPVDLLTCQYCLVSQGSMTELCLHLLKDHHSVRFGSNVICCEQCSVIRRFLDVEHLWEHNRVCHSDWWKNCGRWLCTACGMDHTTEQEFKEHTVYAHAAFTSPHHFCSVCCEVFPTRTAFDTHDSACALKRQESGSSATFMSTGSKTATVIAPVEDSHAAKSQDSGFPKPFVITPDDDGDDEMADLDDVDDDSDQEMYLQIVEPGARGQRSREIPESSQAGGENTTQTPTFPWENQPSDITTPETLGTGGFGSETPMSLEISDVRGSADGVASQDNTETSGTPTQARVSSEISDTNSSSKVQLSDPQGNLDIPEETPMSLEITDIRSSSMDQCRALEMPEENPMSLETSDNRSSPIVQPRALEMQEENPMSLETSDNRSSPIVQPGALEIPEESSMSLETSNNRSSPINQPRALQMPEETPISLGTSDNRSSPINQLRALQILEETPISLGTSDNRSSPINQLRPLQMSEESPMSLETNDNRSSPINQLRDLEIPEETPASLGTSDNRSSTIVQPRAVEMPAGTPMSLAISDVRSCSEKQTKQFESQPEEDEHASENMITEEPEVTTESSTAAAGTASSSTPQILKCERCQEPFSDFELLRDHARLAHKPTPRISTCPCTVQPPATTMKWPHKYWQHIISHHRSWMWKHKQACSVCGELFKSKEKFQHHQIYQHNHDVRSITMAECMEMVGKVYRVKRMSSSSEDVAQTSEMKTDDVTVKEQTHKEELQNDEVKRNDTMNPHTEEIRDILVSGEVRVHQEKTENKSDRMISKPVRYETIPIDEPLDKVKLEEPLENVKVEEPLDKVKVEEPLAQVKVEEPSEHQTPANNEEAFKSEPKEGPILISSSDEESEPAAQVCSGGYKLITPKIVFKDSPPVENHVCPECGKNLPDVSSLRRHQRIEHPTGLIKCEKCKQRIEVDKISSHVCGNEACDIVPMFPCEFCPERFDVLAAKNRHIAAKHRNQLKRCMICGKAFVTQETLEKHKQKMHPNVQNKKPQNPVSGKVQVVKKQVISSTQNQRNNLDASQQLEDIGTLRNPLYSKRKLNTNRLTNSMHMMYSKKCRHCKRLIVNWSENAEHENKCNQNPLNIIKRTNRVSESQKKSQYGYYDRMSQNPAASLRELLSENQDEYGYDESDAEDNPQSKVRGIGNRLGLVSDTDRKNKSAANEDELDKTGGRIIALRHNSSSSEDEQDDVIFVSTDAPDALDSATHLTQKKHPHSATQQEEVFGPSEDAKRKALEEEVFGPPKPLTSVIHKEVVREDEVLKRRAIEEEVFGPPKPSYQSLVEEVFGPEKTANRSLVDEVFGPSKSTDTLRVTEDAQASYPHSKPYRKQAFGGYSETNMSVVDQVFGPASSTSTSVFDKSYNLEGKSLVDEVFGPPKNTNSSLVEQVFGPPSSTNTSIFDKTHVTHDPKHNSLVDEVFGHRKEINTSLVEQVFGPSETAKTSVLNERFGTRQPKSGVEQGIRTIEPTPISPDKKALGTPAVKDSASINQFRINPEEEDEDGMPRVIEVTPDLKGVTRVIEIGPVCRDDEDLGPLEPLCDSEGSDELSSNHHGSTSMQTRNSNSAVPHSPAQELVSAKYACNFCDKSFSLECDLEIHKLNSQHF